MPRHFGLTGAPRDGRRSAASIRGLNGTSGEHGAAGQRKPPEHSDSRVARRHEHLGAARPAAGASPCSATRACSIAKKYQYSGIERSARRRDAKRAARRLFPDTPKFRTKPPRTTGTVLYGTSRRLHHSLRLYGTQKCHMPQPRSLPPHGDPGGRGLGLRSGSGKVSWEPAATRRAVLQRLLPAAQ